MNNDKQFKQLFLGSIDNQYNRFSLDKETVKKWGFTKVKSEQKTKNKIIDSKWIIDEIDYIIFSTDEYENLFHNYQMLYEEILTKMIMQKDVSMFFDIFK